MIDAPQIDIAYLRCWVGRSEVMHDVVSLRLARELHATLDHEGAVPAMGDNAPLGVHWCLAPTIAPAATLGPDGHPRRGTFLPPIPLQRRMWAGSVLHFHDRLLVGDAVERRSRIADVTTKTGRSGPLCFVEVDHETATERGLALTERQTLVYRAAAPASDPPGAPASTALAALVGPNDPYRDRIASTTLLFRYSALTFNSHRIHYDRAYARDVEGLAGLVVHGPLQATQVLEFAAAFRDCPPASFSFQALTPLFDGVPYRLFAREDEPLLRLWIETGAGVRTFEAVAEW